MHGRRSLIEGMKENGHTGPTTPFLLHERDVTNRAVWGGGEASGSWGRCSSATTGRPLVVW